MDIVWGETGSDKRSKGFGISKIVDHHPEVIDNLHSIFEKMKIARDKGEQGLNLKYKNYRAAIRLKYNGKERKWLMTMFEKAK